MTITLDPTKYTRCVELLAEEFLGKSLSNTGDSVIIEFEEVEHLDMFKKVVSKFKK